MSGACREGDVANDTYHQPETLYERQAAIYRAAPWPTATATATAPRARLLGASELPVDASGGAADFERGYLDGGGAARYVGAFIATLECEGNQWVGYYGGNYYWSRAQFSMDTWAKVVAHFGVVDQYAASDSPYFVGQAVAWWASVVSDVSDQWPTCSIGTGLP